MYTAVARRCTRSVHPVNGRVHGHKHGTCNAVHTGRKHGLLHGRKHGCVHGYGRTMYTVCTWPLVAVYSLCTATLGRVQTVYTAVHGPCTWSVRVPNTAVYAAGTWQNTAWYAARIRPCTYRIHGRARAVSVYTAVFTARVHGRVRTMYTTVHGPSMTRTRPCTRSCTLYTVVFTARVRGRLPCTCTCLWPMYTAVHGRVQSAYGPCTSSVHDPNAAAAPTWPCLQPVACTRPFTACTVRVRHDASQASQKLTTETCWTAITQIQ